MRYRKFQRRNPLRKLSLQIDDVIMEEDEDALEGEDVEEKDSGSEDELGLGKFRQVLGSTNLADEILSEIYGSTEESSSGQPRLSLAEEILEELYGSTGPNTTQEEIDEEENEDARYCSIEEVLEEEDAKRGENWRC